MKRLAFAFIFAAPLFAQYDRPIRYFTTNPTGACRAVTPLWNNWVLGRLYACVGASSVSANDGTWTLITAAGSVSSVAMTGDNVIFNSTVTGSPVTAIGTLIPSLKTQVANRVLAGPSTGADATPTFRALVSADMPAGLGTLTSITLAGTSNQITVTGTCTVTTTGTCTFSLPSGLVLPGTINGITLTTSTGTITLTNGKTFSVLKTLTLDGTDGVTITFPASSATVATLGLTNTFTGRQDASGAASTAPSKVGTSPPGTCVVGDQFFDSDATAGQNLFGCTATNTWTLQAGGSSGASIAAVSFSATPTFDGGSGTVKTFTITLTGNVTSCTLQNFTAGQIATFQITQDGTGSRTFVCSGISNLGTVSGVASKLDTQTFIAPTTSTLTAFAPMWCVTCDASITLPEVSSAPGGIASAAVLYTRTNHLAYLKLNNGSESEICTVLAGCVGTLITAIPNNNVLATNLVSGTSLTMTAPRTYGVCTGTCTVTVPVPAAGYEFCVMNGDNVSTAITLSALGSSAMYENSARTAYGTAGTGTLVLSAAAANKVCILGLDSTHYLTFAYQGTVTVN